LPIALVGALSQQTGPQQAAALVLLSFVGVGNALIDVAGFTLLGRLAPDTVLARVFGVLESLVTVCIGVGAVVAAAVIGWIGLQHALIAIGLICPVLAVLSLRRLRALDRSVHTLDADIGLLRQIPMFRTLPLPSIEQLARGLEPAQTPAGARVFEQGEIGDRYYVIESGTAEVVGDGRVVATLGPGEGFGEIALLRRTPRTATVVASSDLRMRTLGAEQFLPVVLGYTASARDAESTVDDELGRFAPDESFEDPPAAP
jgi:MFS family permease